MTTWTSTHSPLLLLQRATHTSLSALASSLVDLDLTPSEINALANLADGEERSASHLGADMGIRPSTLTGVLDRLEQRGQIARVPRPGDRRAVLIKLTLAGRKVASRIRHAIKEIEHDALRNVSAVDRHGFQVVLDALTAVER